MTDPTPAVVPESDATPFVRLLIRTIRTSVARRPELTSAVIGPGVVVIKSAADAQAATIDLGGAEVRITSGADPAVSTVVTVDIARRLEVVDTTGDGSDELVSLVTALLKPELPSWSEAAREFWRLTSADAGMPSSLVVQNADEEGAVLELGSGTPRYIVHGTSDALAGVFAGADSFLDEVYTGNLRVRGTLPQLSVMAGASFKVRFHV